MPFDIDGTELKKGDLIFYIHDIDLSKVYVILDFFDDWALDQWSLKIKPYGSFAMDQFYVFAKNTKKLTENQTIIFKMEN
jgi:hypothetical protein